jgi:hypothetical protein
MPRKGIAVDLKPASTITNPSSADPLPGWATERLAIAAAITDTVTSILARAVLGDDPVWSLNGPLLDALILSTDRVGRELQLVLGRDAA